MKCSACHEEIETGAVFCGNCGEQVAPQIPQVVATAIPSYAIGGTAMNHRSEILAGVALVIALIGLPSSVVPIVGLVFGLVALMMATKARRGYKHTTSFLAIVFGILTVVSSLLVWAYAAQNTPSGNIPTACVEVCN